MNDDEKTEALEREASDMLSMLPDDWQVDVIFVEDQTCYVAARDARRILVAGIGSTKIEALEMLLENWRKGQSKPYAPAAGSVEELKIKLAIEKG